MEGGALGEVLLAGCLFRFGIWIYPTVMLID